jgi:hypothetical protein
MLATVSKAKTAQSVYLESELAHKDLLDPKANL